MQFSDARVTRSGQMRKDVAFSLRNPETVQEYANAVRGAMDFRNQAKRFGRHGVRVKLCVLRMFPARASTFGIGPVSIRESSCGGLNRNAERGPVCGQPSYHSLPDWLESVREYQFGPDDITAAFCNISNAPAFFGLSASE